MKFRGEYNFLSNFHSAKVVYESVEYPTVENAYQAAKVDDIKLREYFTKSNPVEAKREGKKLSMVGLVRPDWDNIKVNIMYGLLKQKFSHPYLKKKLNEIRGPIIEHNEWHDNFWGSCTCNICKDKGKNVLGKLLMKIREYKK